MQGEKTVNNKDNAVYEKRIELWLEEIKKKGFLPSILGLGK